MMLQDVEALRQKSIVGVLALKRENSPRISDRFWTSPSGYNYGRWADRGYNIALGVLESTAPRDGEAGADYLRRVAATIRARRDEYRADEDDEDGACSGALDAALSAIAAALPEDGQGTAGTDRLEAQIEPEAHWEVWYRDMFDRECPPSVDVSGHGLVRGLMELWARHLCETVRPRGGLGFSRFHLRWDQGHITVEGDWEGAVRLREWVFGTKQHCRSGYVNEADSHVLTIIATAHARLAVAGRTSEPMLAAAANAADWRDFEGRLRHL
jgi:hypothetical protein